MKISALKSYSKLVFVTLTVRNDHRWQEAAGLEADGEHEDDFDDDDAQLGDYSHICTIK